MMHMDKVLTYLSISGLKVASTNQTLIACLPLEKVDS